MNENVNKQYISATIAFNTTSSGQRDDIRAFALEEMAFSKKDHVFLKHLFAATVHGPLIPPGMNRKDHPEKNKVFVTIGTDDLAAIESRLKELVDVDFEIRQ